MPETEQEAARIRWMMIGIGSVLALLGVGSLFATFALPRIVAAHERAEGIGMIEPRTGQATLRSTVVNPRRTLTAVVSVGAGLGLVYAGLRRKRDDGS